MSNDNLGALADSLGRLQGLADALSQGGRPESAEVTDDTGQLSITLTEGRITGLRLGTQWKDHVPPQSLGDQILILTIKPVFDRLHAVLDGAGPTAGSRPAEVAPIAWRFPSQEARDRIATEVLDASREVDRIVDSGAATPPPPDQETYSSRNGLVTATMTQGSLTALDYDESVGAAALQTIVDSTLEALEQAYAATPPTPVAPAAEATELGAAMSRIAALQAEADDYRIR